MRIKLLAACMACVGFSSLQARDLPLEGQDYYALQIASSKDVQALQKLYVRYADLPFVRVERRGALYVLRVGFWNSQSAARQALVGVRAPNSFIRVAAFRPQAMVEPYWKQDEMPSAVPAPAPSAPVPVPVVAALPPLPSRKVPQTGAQSEVLRPFNQEDFSLSYDVLLGGGDLARAFQVARQAVLHAPQDRSWRRKLAQVAEWTQHPEIAAQQWSALFQQGDHSPDTLSNVIRLAFYLDDPEIALQVWLARAQQAPLTDGQWETIFGLYESIAEPARGSRYFESQFRNRKIPLLLEYAARLAENAGEDERAGNLYMERAGLSPFSLDVVLRAVVNLVRRDQMREALALMQTHADQVPQDASEFWRLLSQVAWELRDYDSAQGAYRRFVQTPLATAADWSRLIFLVRPKHPAQAAGLALDAYRRFGAQEQLVLALEIYAEVGDLAAQARVYASLDAQALASAQREVRFLLMRARFHQQQKSPTLAWADLRLALQQAPNATDVILATFWFLLDEGRTDELSAVLQQYVKRGSDDPAYWLAFAAANQALDRHREAAVWYSKELHRNPENPLVLLNFADALERSQREGMADRVRRHAWLLLQQKLSAQPFDLDSLGKNPELQAVLRLAISNQPGDPGLRLVRQLAKHLRGVPSDPVDEGQLRELVLGWAISQEQFTNARAWMWLRYARQAQAAPLWGESQVALQLEETQTMDRLLSQNSQGMPIYNRYDTAYALGHVQQSLDIAFQGMAQQQEDEPLYDRFRQHAPQQANYIQLRAASESLGAFEQQGLSLGAINRAGVQWEARWMPDPKLQVLLGWSRMGQSGPGPDLAQVPVESDQLEHAEARWRGDRGESRVALFSRNAWQQYTGLQLNQTLQWGDRINLEAGLDYRMDSTASQLLQVYGYENNLHASLNYTLGKREYFRISPRVTQYYTQFDDYLGAGHILDLEAGYRIRTEYPDWRVRAFSTHQHYFYAGAPAAGTMQKLQTSLQTNIVNGTVDPAALFVPASGSIYGVCAGMGENLEGQDLRNVYSRAWRPFLDVCVNGSTSGSDGYTGLLGIAGSLTGEDHISLQWQNSGGYVAGSAETRALVIRYRRYF